MYPNVPHQTTTHAINNLGKTETTGTSFKKQKPLVKVLRGQLYAPGELDPTSLPNPSTLYTHPNYAKKWRSYTLDTKVT